MMKGEETTIFVDAAYLCMGDGQRLDNILYGSPSPEGKTNMLLSLPPGQQVNEISMENQMNDRGIHGFSLIKGENVYYCYNKLLCICVA